MQGFDPQDVKIGYDQYNEPYVLVRDPNTSIYKPIYVKQEDKGGKEKSAELHIHLDLEQSDPEANKALLQIGFRHDYCDPDEVVTGYQGDPNVKFPTTAPDAHYTLKPKILRADGTIDPHATALQLLLKESSVDAVINHFKIPGYRETEILPIDKLFNEKPFDETMYEMLVPKVENVTGDIDPRMVEKIHDFTTGETHERILPVRFVMRTLKGPPKEPFRRGEFHVAADKGRTDTRVWRGLLAPISPSTPCIVKVTMDPEGNLKTHPDGSIARRVDSVMTVQGRDARYIAVAGHVVATIADAVGGLRGASMKVEPLLAHKLYQNIDPAEQVPMVFQDMLIAPHLKEVGIEIGLVFDKNGIPVRKPRQVGPFTMDNLSYPTIASMRKAREKDVQPILDNPESTWEATVAKIEELEKTFEKRIASGQFRTQRVVEEVEHMATISLISR